jgi:coenzyme F420-reducing hydrogenase gamma subunit
MAVTGIAPHPRPQPNPRWAAKRRPRVGVVKFSSCDGCQLTLLDMEDELLAIAERFDIVEFAEATSNRSHGPFDILLVEGSVSTPEQAEEIVQLRRQAATLVAIGACATSGGIQALRNLGDHDAFRNAVYPRPEWIEALPTSKPISDYVAVEAELYGCPISGRQLLELLTSLSVGRRPQLPDEAVCAECKRLGNTCVLVAGGVTCLGPVTRTGCGALCPSFDRGCFGCFGPREAANTESLANWFGEQGKGDQEIAREFAKFNVGAPAFLKIVEKKS